MQGSLGSRSLTGGRRVLAVRRIFGRVLGVLNHRAAEAHPDLFQLFQIFRVQRRVPFPDVIDGIGHPLDLMLTGRAEDAAAVDVAEQLITSPLKLLVLRTISFPTHDPSRQRQPIRPVGRIEEIWFEQLKYSTAPTAATPVLRLLRLGICAAGRRDRYFGLQ
jgi:hypothetical protein